VDDAIIDTIMFHTWMYGHSMFMAAILSQCK